MQWRPLIGSLVAYPVAVLLLGGGGSESGLNLAGTPLAVRPAWLIPLPWGVWLALLLLTRRQPEHAARWEGIHRAWSRADPWIAGSAIHLALFRGPEASLASLALWLIGVLLIWALVRASGPVLVTLASVVLVFGVALPNALYRTVLTQVALEHTLDVDHRMLPDGKEINSDGIRFRGEASDLSDDDFVVLFLGDSFTYGFRLPYLDSYPYQLQRLARKRGCQDPVRVVNMGWTSSSPLLGLRLLREVGARYRPDLIVYSLDTSDFHDDLRYEKQLRKRPDFELDSMAVLERIVAVQAPWALPLLVPVRAVHSRLRGSDAGTSPLIYDLEIPKAGERFFATQYPLDMTRPAIEAGVMKNLGKIDRLSRDVLGVPMVLVIYPRAYQYSLTEAPQNWERMYEVMPPNAREPFRYFAEVRESLDYEVIDLFSAFDESEEKPLFFLDDPHWNRTGSRLAARVVLDELVSLDLVRCP